MSVQFDINQDFGIIISQHSINLSGLSETLELQLQTTYPYMNLSLEQCLQYLLYRDRSLILPGVGLLRVQRSPAHFNDSRTVLEPPSFLIEFDEDLSNLSSQIPDEYQKEYNFKVQSLNDALLKQGKSELFGMGILQREANSIRFYPNETLFATIFGGLKPIDPISEVKRVYQPEETFVPPTTLIDRKKNKEWGPLVIKWMVGLALVGVLLYFLLYFPWPSGDNGSAPTVVAETDTIASEPASNPITFDAIEPTKPIEATPLSDTLNITPNSIEKETVEYIIITGSFKQNNYIQRMQNRLKRHGYKVFLGDNDSTTRVGVKIKCTAEELPDHLARIRAKFNQQAWVLTQ